MPNRYVSVALARGSSSLDLEIELDRQRKAIRAHTERVRGSLVMSVEDLDRSFNEASKQVWLRAIGACQEENAILLIAAFMPVSRELQLLEIIQEAKIPFVCCDIEAADESSLPLLIQMSIAETRLKSERARVSMTIAREKGATFGNPNIGKLNKGKIPTHLENARERAKAVNRSRAEGFAELLRPTVEQLIFGRQPQTLKSLAASLNEKGIATRRGGTWSIDSVRGLLNRLNLKIPKKGDTTQSNRGSGEFS